MAHGTHKTMVPKIHCLLTGTKLLDKGIYQGELPFTGRYDCPKSQKIITLGQKMKIFQKFSENQKNYLRICVLGVKMDEFVQDYSNYIC